MIYLGVLKSLVGMKWKADKHRENYLGHSIKSSCWTMAEKDTQGAKTVEDGEDDT